MLSESVGLSVGRWRVALEGLARGARPRRFVVAGTTRADSALSDIRAPRHDRCTDRLAEDRLATFSSRYDIRGPVSVVTTVTAGNAAVGPIGWIGVETTDLRKAAP